MGSWVLTNKGILLPSDCSGQISELQTFDFSTHRIHSVAEWEKASFWLSSSAKGSSTWYSELSENQAREVFEGGLDWVGCTLRSTEGRVSRCLKVPRCI